MCVRIVAYVRGFKVQDYSGLCTFRTRVTVLMFIQLGKWIPRWINGARWWFHSSVMKDCRSEWQEEEEEKEEEEKALLACWLWKGNVIFVPFSCVSKTSSIVLSLSLNESVANFFEKFCILRCEMSAALQCNGFGTRGCKAKKLLGMGVRNVTEIFLKNRFVFRIYRLLRWRMERMRKRGMVKDVRSLFEYFESLFYFFQLKICW